MQVWNLRLPGGLFVQCPRIVTDATAGLFRLAWLPDDENLLRVEAGVTALQPIVTEDDMMVGFEPPSLVSLRSDMMKNLGELENVSRPSRDWNFDDEKVPATESGNNGTDQQEESQKAEKAAKESQKGSQSHKGPGDSGLDAVRDALSL